MPKNVLLRHLKDCFLTRISLVPRLFVEETRQ